MVAIYAKQNCQIILIFEKKICNANLVKIWKWRKHRPALKLGAIYAIDTIQINFA